MWLMSKRVVDCLLDTFTYEKWNVYMYLISIRAAYIAYSRWTLLWHYRFVGSCCMLLI